MKRVEIASATPEGTPKPLWVPEIVNVRDDYKEGGEALVYFSEDDRFAVKIFKPVNNRPHPKGESVSLVIDLFARHQTGGKRHFVRPLARVKTIDSAEAAGYIMEKVPQSFQDLLDLIFSNRTARFQFERGFGWRQYLKVAHCVAATVAALHMPFGAAHSDIHFRNFKANLEAGVAVMLELDGIVVDGHRHLRPYVKGLAGFMAPEVVMEKANPSDLTDRHSLAVLVLHTLLFRNPMQPQRDVADSLAESERLNYGSKALFSEHPLDTRNHPELLGRPFFEDGDLSYRMLTPELQSLAERALIDGLFTPHLRPQPQEWVDALARAQEELVICEGCCQGFPYPYIRSAARRFCPFCGVLCEGKYLVLELFNQTQRTQFGTTRRRVVFADGQILTASHTTDFGVVPPAEPDKRHGCAYWNEEKGGFELRNETNRTWIARPLAGGARVQAAPGERLLIRKGFLLEMGDSQRMAMSLDG